jgi:hypothetical protein
MSRLGVLWLICVVVLAGSAAFGQLGSYNPYAPYVEDKPSADGTAPWPPFYKPKQVDPKHALKYAMGWCRWKPEKYQYDPSDLVDVSRLPEVSHTGRFLAAVEGGFTALGDNFEPLPVMVHANPAVTRVRVRGEAVPVGLQKGMVVRFTGKIDEQGRGLEPIGEVQVFSPSPQFRFPDLVPHEKRTLVGTVAWCRAGELAIVPQQGDIRRVTVRLASDVKIEVNSSDYTLASEGDEATVKGHLYRPDSKLSSGVVFATQIELRLAQPLGAPKKRR